MKLSKYISENSVYSNVVYIVGKGRSLKFVSKETFGDGIIITLNESVFAIEKLNLHNTIFSMQKDGAIRKNDIGEFICINECTCARNNLSDCPFGMIKPTKKETILLVSESNSIECYTDYEPRFVFDNSEYNLKWDEPSVLTAIEMSKQIGAKKIILVSFDSFTSGDNMKLLSQSGLVQEDLGYPSQHERMKKLLSNIDHEFITPENDFKEVSHVGF
jgi:hypothetical protein